MEYELRHRKHSVGQNTYHFVWSPKFRLRIFRQMELRRVCEGYLRLIALQHGMSIFELKVMPDHVHLFVELPPTISISRAMQLLKGKSSRFMRKRFAWLRYLYKDGHMWSPGKFFRSVGNVTAETIEHYIKNSHHDWSYYKKEGTYDLLV